MRVGDVIYRCKAYTLRGPHSALITLTEGKNRELRNVFISRNIRLKRVHRLRIGPITLRGIPAGHFRRLTEREVNWFFDHAEPRPPRPAKIRTEKPRAEGTDRRRRNPGGPPAAARPRPTARRGRR